MAKRFEEMTDEEKLQALQKWMEARNARKAKNVAKRAALKALVAAHKAEFEQLMKGGKVAPQAKK